MANILSATLSYCLDDEFYQLKYIGLESGGA